MSYLVLARKYRPKLFGDVVGQEHITKTLAGALATDRLAHAFIFTGPRGVGKTSVARILAKAVNCENGPTDTPCGKCVHCREIDEQKAVDVQEIDAASNSRVEDVRELREVIRYRPQSARFKVTILDEVHMLSKAAFNALLKTLEEPPSHAIFILATTDVHKVPLTILSRCQRYDFRRLSPVTLADHMQELITAENCSMPRQSLSLMAREADGSVRDSLSILDQVLSVGKKNFEHDEVVELLGLVDKALVNETSQAILQGDAGKVLDLVGQVYGAGGEMQSFYAGLQEHFRNLAAAKAISPGSELFGLTADELNELKKQAEKVSPETLHEIFDLLASSEELFRKASQPRLVMEMTLLKLTQVKPVLGLDQVVNRLMAISSGQKVPELKNADFGENIAFSQSAPPRNQNFSTYQSAGNVSPERSGLNNGVPSYQGPHNSNSVPNYQSPRNSNSAPNYQGPQNSNNSPSYQGPQNSNSASSYNGPENSQPQNPYNTSSGEKKTSEQGGKQNKVKDKDNLSASLPKGNNPLPQADKALQDLARYCGRTEPSFASYLSRAKASLDGDLFSVCLPASPMAQVYASEEYQQKLTQMLTELFSSSCRVKLSAGKVPQKSEQDQGPAKMELLNELANHSVVQEALDVFEAQVVSLNPLGPTK